MDDFFAFVLSHSSDIMVLIKDHMRLTIITVFIAIAAGIPLGILIASIKGIDKPVLGFANIMQAVPSLAALGLLVPFMGIGSPPAILMVVLYSLLPILKNTYTGIVNINPQTIEAAFGIGMTHIQVLMRVKLPLALPVIMAGVRIASVTSVGLMTIAAYIGAGGLGNYVISGIETNNTNLTLCGAIPACILALLMDYVMLKVEKAVVPISLSMPATSLTPKKIRQALLRRHLTLAVLGALFLTLLARAVLPLFASKDEEVIVASKPAVEGQIAGHIISDVIEAHTGLKVTRKMGQLGGTAIIYNAIVTGEIDIYPDYSGSLYSAIFKRTPPPGTPPLQVVEEIRDLVMQDGLVYTGIYGFNNRYTLGVLPEMAEKYNLEKISDLENVPIPLTLACDQVFPNRADGVPALNAVYKNLKFEKYLQFKGALMYQALINKKVDVMTPFTTDALLAKYNIKILEDDKSALSNYNMATVVRKDTLDAHPELKEALAILENNISDEEMTKMNYEVIVNERSIGEVAREFLENKGLL